MKKLLSILVLILTLLVLVGCSGQEPDTYDKLEIAGMFYDVTAEIESLQDVLDTLQAEGLTKDQMIADLLARIDELETAREEQATQTQVSRFFDMLVETSLLGGELQFVKLGNTVTGDVDNWSYAYIVIELTRDAQVEIIFDVANEVGEWDMNIYHNNLYDPSYTEESIGVRTYGIYDFKEGWNIIELDSYSDITSAFELRILEVL